MMPRMPMLPRPKVALKPKTTIAPARPEPLPTKPEIALKPKTHWMRPPQGTATDEGLMPGDPGYVDPHAEAMKEWKDIDKGETGGFRPDGTVILHSDPDSAHSLSLAAQSAAQSEGGGYGKKRKAEMSRGQMNLTGSKGSTILTS